MKQPELGIKISELRKQKGITQNELSEACNIDIRTVQRIESGEVVPRSSTLKLIAECLDCDFGTLYNGDSYPENDRSLSRVLLLSFCVGIIYFINFIIYANLIPWIPVSFRMNMHLWLSMIHILTGVLFYFGVYLLSRHYKNKILQITLIIAILSIPLFVAIDFLSVVHLKTLIVIIISINGIVLGIGLLQMNGKFSFLYKIAGILQITVNPLYIVPIYVVQWIGLWLAVPFILILLIVVILEWNRLRNDGVQNVY